MQIRTFIRGYALRALLLAVGSFATGNAAYAQNLEVRGFRFSSVGVHYPVETHSQHPRKFSLQGGGGQAFSTTDKPSSAQFGVQGGFAQTKLQFAYKGHLELGDFLNRPPFTLDKVPLHVRVYSGLDGSIVDELEGHADANGDFTAFTDANPAPLIDGEPKLTQMSLKAPHWLRLRLIPAQPDTPEGYPIVHFSLINGDANGDNVVDTLDNEFVAHHMQSKLDEPKYDPNADLNGDAQVTPDDLQIVHDHRNEKGDE